MEECDRNSQWPAGGGSEGISVPASLPHSVLFFNHSNYMFITFSLFPLQADYNVIKRIDSGALRFLYKLRVLILNDNLIPVLPAHLFR